VLNGAETTATARFARYTKAEGLMTQEPAERDAIESVRTYARRLFAEIAVRIVAYGADMIVILFVMVVLDNYVLNLIGLNDASEPAIWAVLMIVYFTASWTSPLRATPMQFLFGMRVLHESGEGLSLRDAAIRSVALVALWGFVLFVLRQLFVQDWWLKIAAVMLLLYLPSITARRQGLHDFLARSVVLNKRALRSADDEQRMRDFLADQEPSVRRTSRPPIYKMAIDAVAVLVPLFLMTTVIEISQQKNAHGRVAYAMNETQEAKLLAQSWFETTGDWPKTESDIGRPLRHNYPAGGYFELEENGVIRIQFELRPELKSGSILIEPQVNGGEVSWQCRAVGDIERRYLPGRCRD